MRPTQSLLFSGDAEQAVSDASASTFVNNMDLPVHRWFRYSAGFSAEWAEAVIRQFRSVAGLRVFDPFAGSATTLLAAETRKVESWGIDAHLMVACYFRDLALVWQALRRVCAAGAKVCFVVGDSAPYGVYVPVVPWLAALAQAAGLGAYRFERTRDRNVKWKNRKHRVPLQEGRLWIEG